MSISSSLKMVVVVGIHNSIKMTDVAIPIPFKRVEMGTTTSCLPPQV